jgi:hypothetical protein
VHRVEEGLLNRLWVLSSNINLKRLLDPELKKVDVTKKKATEVASTSGTKIPTSNPFDAPNMIDTDECGISTDIVTKDGAELDYGNTVKAKEVGPTPIVEKIELEKLIIDGKSVETRREG